MEEILKKVEQSQILKAFLRGRIPVDENSPGCAPCCKWILEDLELNGRLTGWPYDSMNSPQFPIAGKVLHLASELGVEERIDGDRVKKVSDLLPFIDARLSEMEEGRSP